MPEVSEKWGFGLAPPKPDTHLARIVAAKAVLHVLTERGLPTGRDVLSHLSTVQGLFNRVRRQDQWDWFTVSGGLGYPSSRIAAVIASEIKSLRSAIRGSNEAAFLSARTNLLRLPFRKCLAIFL